MTEEQRWAVDLLVNAVIGIVTIVALVVAISQANQARRDATKARESIARERRLAFELNLLAELYDQFAITGTQHLSGHVNALIRDSSDGTDIPLLRVATGAKASFSNEQLLNVYPRNSRAFSERVILEIDEAITRRLEEKP